MPSQAPRITNYDQCHNKGIPNSPNYDESNIIALIWKLLQGLLLEFEIYFDKTEGNIPYRNNIVTMNLVMAGLRS